MVHFIQIIKHKYIFIKVSTLNRLTDQRHKSKQLIVLDTTNSNGLFVEDYIDILMLTQPLTLLSQLTAPNSQKKIILNSQTVTRTFLNTILFRENYLWKKSFTKKAQPQPQIHQQQPQQPPQRPQINQMLETSVLDLFDSKFSNPILSIQESHDIFYSSHANTSSAANDGLVTLLNQYTQKKRSRKARRMLSPFTLEQFDENSVCMNAIKRLANINTNNNTNTAATTANNATNNVKTENNNTTFLLHDWLHEKKEIKSNLELTKSLKLIQPLLEETVQKKYTTSRMWESFQGPLTWQHFCRLAFRDASNGQNTRHLNHQTSISSGAGKKIFNFK